MKQTIIILGIVLFAGVGAYFLTKGSFVSVDSVEEEATQNETERAPERTPQEEERVVSEETDSDEDDTGTTLIGTSAGGHDILAYHYGEGTKELLFVGGIHGGYSWNTALVAYELVDYLLENPGAVPDGVRVTVIPTLNPDGLETVLGSTGRFQKADVPTPEGATIPGRFNARGVDLNRNFDCEWQEEGMWQERTVSGGAEPFSEPESRALKAYVEGHDVEAVVVWYSAAGGVFASSCRNGVLAETQTIMDLYADASGYTAYDDFDFYEITGDMVNWLAKNDIPAISVLLTTHDSIEWDMNKKGIEALLAYYAK